jgi:hypothetical protein
MSEIDSHLTETDRPNSQISIKSSQVNGAVLQFKKDYTISIRKIRYQKAIRLSLESFQPIK